jgi:hypothetical protein
MQDGDEIGPQAQMLRNREHTVHHRLVSNLCASRNRANSGTCGRSEFIDAAQMPDWATSGQQSIDFSDVIAASGERK